MACKMTAVAAQVEACSCGCTGTNAVSGTTAENQGYCYEQDYEYAVNPFGDAAWKRKDDTESCPCACTLIPCVNIELCGVKQPGWCFDTSGGWGSTSQYGNLCSHCDGMRYSNIRDREDLVQRDRESTKPWQRLEFKDATERCPVCLEQKDRVVKFPHCTHYFCLDCTWSVLHGHGELDYHLSPVPYGCPPCPNGCENPTRGVQCYCKEYFNSEDEEGPLGVFQQWGAANPQAYEAYNAAESVSIDVRDHPVYGSGTCPLCRSSYP